MGCLFYSDCRSKAEESVSHKKALIGANLLYEEPVALFLPDQGRIISISGSTFLRGVTYLPQKVVRPASIEGQPFIYKDLTLGAIKPSPKNLPAVNSEIFRFADHYLKDGFSEDDSIVDINSLDSMIVKNSFMNKTLIVRCKEPADLSGVTFSGNIIIWSTQPINLTESTRLTDVILFAPSIIINDHFSGSFQAYALQYILVGSNCNLAFPTILNVIQSERKYNPSDSLKITIGRNTRVDGGIFIKSSGLTSYLKVSPKSRIFGQVYIPGNIELLGEVTGSVYCKSFYLQTSRARYENHLLNCRIDRVRLSPYFAGIDLFRNNPYKSIIEWLN